MVIDGVPLKERTPTPEEAKASGEEPEGEEKKAPLTPPMLPNPKSVPQS
jgi:hypothetical protein